MIGNGFINVLKYTNESQNESSVRPTFQNVSNLALSESKITEGHLSFTDNSVSLPRNQTTNNDDNTPELESISIQKILSEIKRRRNQSNPFQTEINNQQGEEFHTNHRFHSSSSVSKLNNFLTNSEVTILPPKRKVDEHEDSFTKNLNAKDFNTNTLLETTQSSFIEG